MFRTTLQVSHLNGKTWMLTRPLVWEGHWEYYVIKEGFETDFASIPKPVRWLLDSAGGNAEAAVLHDAVWRESQRPVGARVDPWHADGMFRSSLRETGSTALTRALMWFAVRATATVHGRFGKLGPPLVIKLLQLLAIFVLGAITALVPTLVALVGLFVYWIASWVVAVVWQVFERVRLHESPNWPWPLDEKPKREKGPVPEELLVIIDKPRDAPPLPGSPAARLEALLDTGTEVTNTDIDTLTNPTA